MPDKSRYDLDYRPNSYFAPDNPDLVALSRICGTARRAEVERAVANGGRVLEDSLRPLLDDDERTIAASIHPSLMGGEYLPDFVPGEVEIVRIDLASVMSDAISVRARPGSDRIRYRIIDEYMEEDCEYRLAQKTSRKPLTLGQLVRLLGESEYVHCGKAWAGGIVNYAKEHNFACNRRLGNLEELRRFVRVSSVYYPQLESWYDDVAEEWYREKAQELGFEAVEPEEREKVVEEPLPSIRRVSVTERALELIAESEAECDPTPQTVVERAVRELTPLFEGAPSRQEDPEEVPDRREPLEFLCGLRWPELEQYAISLNRSSDEWELWVRQEGDEWPAGPSRTIDAASGDCREAAMELLKEFNWQAHQLRLPGEDPVEGLLTLADCEELNAEQLKRGKQKYASMMWSLDPGLYE